MILKTPTSKDTKENQYLHPQVKTFKDSKTKIYHTKIPSTTSPQPVLVTCSPCFFSPPPASPPGGLDPSRFMTAGRGIRHSEHNLHAEPLRFIQCWVVPRRRGFEPAYGSYTCTDAERENCWALVASEPWQCGKSTETFW